MNGIEKITDKIISDARDYEAQALAEGQKSLDEIMTEYKSNAEFVKKKYSERAAAQSQSIINRAKEGIVTTRRNLLLSVKSEMINKAYDGAAAKLKALSDDEYFGLLCDILTAALAERAEVEKTAVELYGEENTNEPCEVILSCEDFTKHGEKLIASIKKSDKIPAAVLSRVRLCKECANIDGGLILKCGDVESNCSFAMLISSARQADDGQTNKILFENSN